MCLIYAFLVSFGGLGGGWGWYFGNLPEIRETKKKIGQQRKSAPRRRRRRRHHRRGCRTRRWRHRALLVVGVGPLLFVLLDDGGASA